MGYHLGISHVCADSEAGLIPCASVGSNAWVELDGGEHGEPFEFVDWYCMDIQILLVWF